MTRQIRIITNLNRTGSWWLGTMICSATDVEHVRAFPDNSDPATTWQAEREHSPYVCKVAWHHIDDLWGLLSPAEKRYARFVHLTRRDVWRQAISQYRMQSSGVDHWHRGEDIDAAHRDVEYDGEAIAACHRLFTVEQQKWRDWYAAKSIRPLWITYEQLQAHTDRIVRNVLRHFRIAQLRPIDTERGQITRDEITEVWMDLLAAEGYVQ